MCLKDIPFISFSAFTLAIVIAAYGNDIGDEGADNTENSEDTESSDLGEEAEDRESASVEAGEEVFQNNCASCHGKDLSGAAGPNLTEIGSNYSQDEIADIDENGTDEGMPAFPDIEDNDLDEFAKWLSEHK